MAETIIYLVMDTLYYLGLGFLLTVLLEPARGRFALRGRHAGSLILIALYVVSEMFLHNSGFAKRILYGSDMVMQSSRKSIVAVTVSFLVTYFICRVMIKEKRLRIFYGVTTFYAVIELGRFGFYTVLFRLFSVCTDRLFYMYSEKRLYSEQVFLRLISAAQVMCNLITDVVLLLFAAWVIKRLKKYVTIDDSYGRQELWFLIFPGIMGLLICALLRSIMYTADNGNVQLLIEFRPEMNVLIPCLCLLCVVLLLVSARMLRRIIDESSRRVELGIYRNRIDEMEKHIADIEGLYAGIRGMKHDMKNYIADMDALMKQNTDSGAVNSAMREYLNSMQNSVEQLDMKFNTGNPVTDVVLQRYAREAEKSNISLSSDFIFPTDMNIAAFDISIIMNNGLENAVEACRAQKSGKKTIELTAYRRGNMFFIIIKNSFDGEPAWHGGRPATTKADAQNHGFGLRNIEACARKYLGRAETTVKDGYFELAVMLQDTGEA